MKNGEKNKIIITIIMAAIFGLAGGIVGELVARAYFFENNFNIPLFGEINFSGLTNGGSNVVIRDARKVVVEQDAKISETAAAAGASLVGIFNRITSATSSKPAKNQAVDASAIRYQLSDKLAEGFIITSDGWIISDFIPKELANQNKKATATPVQANRYVIIAKDKKVYIVDSIISDPLFGYSFWRIKATGLPVRKFATQNEIINGQTIMALNWLNDIFITSIVRQTENIGRMVKSSDEMNIKIILVQEPDSGLAGGFLFNLNGDLLGFIGHDKINDSIANLQPVINNFLKNKNIEYPSLGVNYRDLNESIPAVNNQPEKGALITKNDEGIAVSAGSPAAKVGLQAGDIIISVNQVEIDQNNSLNKEITNYFPGDKIALMFLRNGIKKEVEIILSKR